MHMGINSYSAFLTWQ